MPHGGEPGGFIRAESASNFLSFSGWDSRHCPLHPDAGFCPKASVSEQLGWISAGNFWLQTKMSYWFHYLPSFCPYSGSPLIASSPVQAKALYEQDQERWVIMLRADETRKGPIQSPRQDEETFSASCRVRCLTPLPSFANH